MSHPIASVDVPASSANLGSGFDCFAVALSLKLRAELFAGDDPGILLNAHGEGAPREDDGPKLDVATTVRKAVPVIASSERPVCCVEQGKVVGVVDKDAVLTAIAGEGE
jgi:homoserine kinase